MFTVFLPLYKNDKKNTTTFLQHPLRKSSKTPLFEFIYIYIICIFWTRRYKTLVFAVFLRHRHRHVSQMAVFSSSSFQSKPICVVFLHDKKYQKAMFRPNFPIFQLWSSIEKLTCLALFLPPLIQQQDGIQSQSIAKLHLLSHFLCHNHCHKVLKMTPQPVWTEKSCKSCILPA